MALALALPVLVLAMGPMLVPALAALVPHAVSGWLQLLLTTPIFFWSGWFFIRRWAKSLRELDPNMFTFTVTGTGAAYFYSLAAVLFADRFPASLRLGEHGVPLYFEATAFITMVVLLGQILEQRAHARTDAAIRALMDLAPAVAHRVGADGHEQDIPLAEVAVDDVLRVRSGDKVPVDGVLSEGASDLDEAMLTADQSTVARVIATEAGIDECRAELLPEDKVQAIRQLKTEGTVMMIGDGVNDAPALATAHLGVAMGAAGTDVAMETADVVLMGDKLENIPLLLGMARQAKRLLTQNLVFASAVILVLLAATLGMALPLPVGVIGHEGSTVIVCLNGLRLLIYRGATA